MVVGRASRASNESVYAGLVDSFRRESSARRGVLQVERCDRRDDGLVLGAGHQLVEQLGAEVAGALFVVELTFLDGRSKLAGTDVHALIAY